MSVCVASVCYVCREGLVTIPLKKVSCLNVGLNKLMKTVCFFLIREVRGSGTLDPLILPRPREAVI